MVCASPKTQVIKSSCACHIDRLLHQRQSYIFITGAQPIHDPKSFIVYSIRLNDKETKRRYSDFESLRNVLARLHPIIIVPPIPEKHSLLEYAVLQNRAKSDVTTIEKRKRMLQSFLNQVAKHPYLGHNHLFHQFLDPNVVWADVLRSSPLSALLKQQPLHLVMTTTTTEPNMITPWIYQPLLTHRSIPAPPTTTRSLQRSDPFLLASEERSELLSDFMQQHVEKSQRKVIRRMGELALDYAELGAVYNGFSLNETKHVARAIERMGQTVDEAYTETGQLVNRLEADFVEPMQSQTHRAQLVKQVIEFQYLKQCQLELIELTLDRRRREMDRLLEMEEELHRSDHVYEPPPLHSTDKLSPPTKQTNRQSSASFATRLLNSASYSLQAMIDVDPASTRRNHVVKSKEALQILEEALSICRNDINLLSEQLHNELLRYEKDKATLFREILLSFATTHLRYCQKNLRAWQDTKIQVNKIPLEE